MRGTSRGERRTSRKPRSRPLSPNVLARLDGPAVSALACGECSVDERDAALLAPARWHEVRYLRIDLGVDDVEPVARAAGLSRTSTVVSPLPPRCDDSSRRGKKPP
jgi:hypothetical protein